MAVFHLFLWLRSIPLGVCTTSPLSNHLLKDILVPSMSWPPRARLYFHNVGHMHWDASGRYDAT